MNDIKQFHESAIIYDNVQIGDNAIVEAFAIIGFRCTIYDNVVAGIHFDISDQTTIFYNNRFGDNCRIGPKAIIKNGCIVGNQVRINAKVFMEEVVIGSMVFIGPGVTFTDDIHPPCPKRTNCVPKSIVEDYVSIGANVVIAPGIRIGHHTQIYAGSIVVKDVEPYSVIAGNPGKRIKDIRELKCRSGYFDKPFIWWDENVKIS